MTQVEAHAVMQELYGDLAATELEADGTCNVGWHFHHFYFYGRGSTWDEALTHLADDEEPEVVSAFRVRLAQYIKEELARQAQARSQATVYAVRRSYFGA